MKTTEVIRTVASCLIAASMWIAFPAVGSAAAAENQISYTVKQKGRVSLGVYSKDSRLVRMLFSGEKKKPGTYTAVWDGLDEAGQPAPVGEYVAKGVAGDVSCRYVMTYGSEGRPPWPIPDGKGAWGALWGNVMAVAADKDGFVYLCWLNEEGEAAFVKVKPDGGEGDFVQWKTHKPWSWGYGVDVAVDNEGEYVYFLCCELTRNYDDDPTKGTGVTDGFIRLRKDTGEEVPYKDSPNKGRPTSVGRFYNKEKELIPDWAEKWEGWGRKFQWTLAGEREKPERRLGPPSVQYRFNARALAVSQGKIYITLYLEDKIAVIDAASGKQVSEIAGIVRPQGIAADATGNVYVASGTNIIKIAPDGKVLGPVVKQGLVAPYGVEVDAKGAIYVADEGTSMQLKVFSPAGPSAGSADSPQAGSAGSPQAGSGQAKLTRTVGKEGGRAYWGSYKKEQGSFLYPGHPAVDTKGRVYVPEDDAIRRVAIVENGKVEKAWFGPLCGGCNAQLAADPSEPELVYHTPAASDLVRYRLDYDKGTWVIDAYWNGFTTIYGQGGIKRDYLALTHTRDVIVRHYKGHTYLIVTTPYCIYRVEGFNLIPVVVAGNTEDGQLICQLSKQWAKPFPSDNGKSAFVWTDRNGDWQVQENEVDRELSPDLQEMVARTGKIDSGYSGFYVDDQLNLYFHDPRWQYKTPPEPGKDMGSGGVWMIPCSGVDKAGIPQYALVQAKLFLKDKTSLPELDFARMNNPKLAGQFAKLGPQYMFKDKEGNWYFTWSLIGLTDIGINWAASNPFAKAARFDADGTLRWYWGNKARSIARPGEMYVPHGIAGVEKECLFVADRNAQLRVFDRTTGLYVESLLNDVYVGPMPDEYTLALTHELTGANVVVHPKSGKVYAHFGDYSGSRCYEILGLDSIERFETPLTVKTAAVARTDVSGAVKAGTETGSDDLIRIRTAVVIPPAPEGGVTVDGKLDEWRREYPAGPITLDPAHPEIMSHRSGFMYCMYDRDNLYIAAEVLSDFPLLNLTKQGNWYFYDSIQVRIQTPNVRECYLGMYQRTEDGKDFYIFNPFDPATGKVKEVVNPAYVKLAFSKRPDGRGYAMESAIPWKEIDPKFEFKPGAEFNCGLQLNWTAPDKLEIFHSDRQIQWNAFYRPGTFGPAFLLPPVPIGKIERKHFAIPMAPKIAIDGDLGDWILIGGAPLAMDLQNEKFRGTAWAAYDDEFLYIAFDVNDTSPMQNAGEDLETIFKTGDTAELFLSTNPNADPNRREPEKTDYRVVLTTLRNKRPVVIGFHPVAGDVPRYHEQPGSGRKTRMDKVEIVEGGEAAFKVRADKTGYTAEAKIPWSYFGGFQPKADQQVPCNLAINFSDESGQKNVSKIYWNGPNAMTADVPIELQFNPQNWGYAHFSAVRWKSNPLTMYANR